MSLRINEETGFRNQFDDIAAECSIYEIAKMLRHLLLSVDAFKHYINTVRAASYPDIDKFN